MSKKLSSDVSKSQAIIKEMSRLTKQLRDANARVKKAEEHKERVLAKLRHKIEEANVFIRPTYALP